MQNDDTWHGGDGKRLMASLLLSSSGRVDENYVALRYCFTFIKLMLDIVL